MTLKQLPVQAQLADYYLSKAVKFGNAAMKKQEEGDAVAYTGLMGISRRYRAKAKFVLS